MSVLFWFQLPATECCISAKLKSPHIIRFLLPVLTVIKKVCRLLLDMLSTLSPSGLVTCPEPSILLSRSFLHARRASAPRNRHSTAEITPLPNTQETHEWQEKQDFLLI